MTLITDNKKRGFTLLELLVVMGIIALLAGIVLSFFSRSATSQKRFRSLSNMRLISQAMRQYQLDERGLPPFSPQLAYDIYRYQADGTPIPDMYTRPDAGWYGLWALVETGALESPSVLRDTTAMHIGVSDGTDSYQALSNASQGRVEDSFFYCSYQGFDDAVGLWMYLPNRGVISDDPDPLKYRRQLWPYPMGEGQSRWMPSPSTVVLWNPYYRESSDGVTAVLYWDGSVQLKRTFYDPETGVAHPDPAFIDPLDE
ncbi:MAG: type II secretion system protein [Armatimonadetes bacterium]|jgi:prepilin-type N-terminal cleavage/methylation domain-containing protein|nr:type II secretion system protein [Armatimonadota bacterium]MDI9603004.1 type II secretion system protein [Acidobacteriota bacterium]